ncbi:YncE family protein [Pseudomonas chlororaphis subsp. aureofaciens]|uniref:YncE family protein n=1 Tax=Pseudomonas chlororaphis TaxID=587753 RepID=UPI0018E915F2|nr:hypothetical protein [Pseudomonas chlororaphis]
MNDYKTIKSSRIPKPKLLIVLCGILLLCGCNKESDTTTDDNYVFKRGDRIFSQPLEGKKSTTLSTSNEYFFAEINRSGNIACALNDRKRTLSMLHLKNGRVQKEYVFPWHSHDGNWISDGISYIGLSDDGTCLFNTTKSSLAVMTEDAPSRTIKLPDNQFEIRGITYSHSAKMFIITGKSSLFILKGTQKGEELKPIRLHGSYNGIRVREGSQGEALSPDGKTLYALVTGLDKGNSIKNLLASFDTSTGEIVKFYLPHFKDGNQSFEGRHFTFSEDQISPVGERNSFVLTPDGKTIYVTAWINGNVTRTYIIDTVSGELQEASNYQKWSGFQISPTGKYAIEIKAGENPYEADTYVYELSTGKLANKVPGNYCGTIRCGP